MSRSVGANPWGWNVGIRRLVSATPVILALALGGTGRHVHGPPPPPPRLVIDPNTAPPPVLQALPRIGPVLAARIVEAREERPFESLDDLDRRVRGIGPATVKALRPHLRFAADPNAGPPPAPLAARPAPALRAH